MKYRISTERAKRLIATDDYRGVSRRDMVLDLIEAREEIKRLETILQHETCGCIKHF